MEKNPWPKQLTLIVVALLVIGVSFFGGFYFGLASHPEIEKVVGLDNKETGAPEKVDFAPFWKAWNVLNEKYVSYATTTSDQERVWGAIAGLAASLNDPYTVFFPPEENKMFESEVRGNFEGIGVELGIKDNILTIVAPLKDSPAGKAGMMSGDKILKIEDTVTSGLNIDAAIKLIRGKKGTPINFTVLREGKKEPIQIKVIRDTITIPTIDTEYRSSASGKNEPATGGLQPNGVFIIRLYGFSSVSPDLFRNALRQFIESGSNKLILDLRGNPGGYLEAAVDMASWFLPAGKIVVSEDFGENGEPIFYRSHRDVVFNDSLKFAILVDGGTASAAEILAGALREYGVAKLVGTKTFGKGVVQELVDITPETSLKVTVARWLTPKGVSISQNGIMPDVEVKITAEDVAKGLDPQMDAAVKLLLNGK
jgi:carboxyl-terminal processing protease